MRWLLFGICVFFSSFITAQKVVRIDVTGNVKTDSSFIARFFEFEIGDSTGEELWIKIADSQNALMNTGLFNVVDIQLLVSKDSESANIVVSVKERWYFWLYPQAQVFETNFNTWLESPDLRRLSYGFDLTKFNIRGKGQTLRIIARFGYLKEAGLMYEIPYFKNKDHGISTGFSYKQRNEMVYGTMDNKRLFYRTVSEPVVYEALNANLTYTFRLNNRDFTSLSASFNNHNLVDSLARSNTFLPDNQSESNEIVVVAQYRADRRDYRPYPLSGSFTDCQFSAHMFSPSNSYYTVSADVRKYLTLSEKWYTGVGLSGKASLKNQIPYIMAEALGYRNYVRGYERYVLDGRHYALFKSNLKLKVIDKTYVIKKIRDSRLNYIPLKCLVTAFADAGYVWSNQNNFSNSLQDMLISGFGLGIDVVSYYDKVLRVEWSFNNLNETGVFVHFTQPI